MKLGLSSTASSSRKPPGIGGFKPQFRGLTIISFVFVIFIELWTRQCRESDSAHLRHCRHTDNSFATMIMHLTQPGK